MMLSDLDIREFMDSGDIRIFPKPDILQPASIDLTLGEEILFHRYKNGKSPLNIGLFNLHPNSFVLATTQEHIELSTRVAATVSGKSSLARLGLTIHQTGGFIDPGFRGQITLELKNQGDKPVQLVPGMAICQIQFSELRTPASVGYGSRKLKNHYQGQHGPTRSYMEERNASIGGRPEGQAENAGID